MANFYKNICIVSCGENCGTGFFLDASTIITAGHTLSDYMENNSTSIIIRNENPSYENVSEPLSEEYKTNSIAALRITSPNEFKCDHSPSPFSTQELKENDKVTSYGFLSGQERADAYQFMVTRKFENGQLDENCNTYLQPVDRQMNFEGLSGAPLLHEGYMVGIILRQKLEQQKAVRLEAITGSAFRNLIKQYGITVQVCNPPSKESTFCPTTNCPLKSGISEITTLMDSQFMSILEERESGKIITSSQRMHDFLLNLSTSSCSVEAKSKYYLQAALWAFYDGNKSDAKKHLEKALEINPDLDTRIYYARTYIAGGDIKSAKAILVPIDSVDICNTYLNCLLLEGANIDRGQEILSLSGISPNSETYRILALLSLCSNNVGFASEQITLASSMCSQSINIQLSEALIDFWKAIGNIYSKTKKDGFLDITDYFSPSSEQRELLELAYSRLDSIYLDIKDSVQHPMLKTVLWGLLLVGQLLPDKDYTIWLSKLEDVDPRSPNILLFKLRHHLSVSETDVNYFLDINNANLESPIYLEAILQLYIHLKMYSEAMQFYDLHADRIVPDPLKNKDITRLELLLQCNMLDELEEKLNTIDNQTQVNEIARIKLGLIYYRGKSFSKANAKKALALARDSHNPVDFHNANLFCMEAEDYKTQEENAKEWFNTTKELVALEVRADALYHQGRCSKALRIIDRAEKLGDCSMRIKQCKINCLMGLSQFNDALAISNNLAMTQNNSSLVLMQADSHIALGEVDDAVRVLQQFADADQYDLHVYQKLVDLLKPGYPDKAFSYAYNYYCHNPKDEQALRFAGITGLETGHNEVASKFMPLFYKDSQEGKYVQALSMKEAGDYLRKVQEEANEASKNHKSTTIPIHSITSNLGATYLDNWNTKRYNPGNFIHLKDSPPLFTHSNKVILDYTSCITLVKLNLLDFILKVYDDTWICGNLLTIWFEDINQVRTNQPKITERHKALMNELKNLSFKKIEITGMLSRLDPQYNSVYGIVGLCAEDHGAYIIDDSCENTIDGKPIPPNWFDKNIPTACFYHALKMKELPHPDYDLDQVKDDLVEKVNHRCSIILGAVELEKLMAADALCQVFDLYDIVLTSQTVDQIKSLVQEDDYRQSLAQDLQRCYQKVVSYVKLGKIKLAPILQDGNIFSQNKYANMLSGALTFALKSQADFICDDRFITKYPIIEGDNGNSNIFSSYQIILNMYNDEYISKTQFYSAIDTLLAKNYCYFIPPAEYIYNRLQLLDADSFESNKDVLSMKYLRWDIAFAQSPDCGMVAVENVIPELQKEAISYFLTLHHLLEDTLVLVWSSSQSKRWKAAAADWLICACNNSFSSPNNSFEFSFKSPLVEAGLIMLGTKLNTDSKNSQDFMQWLFPYLRISWISDPQLKQKVATLLCDITETLSDNEIEEKNLRNHAKFHDGTNLFKKAKALLLAKIPQDLLILILKDERMSAYRQYFEFNNTAATDGAVSWGITEYNHDLFSENMLNGDDDALENALIAITCDPSKNGEVLLTDILSDDRLFALSDSLKEKYIRFLSILSWYVPEKLSNLAQDKKLKLTLKCSTLSPKSNSIG